MSINRYELVTHHNPVLTGADLTSPLTVGNGEFAFTADITGLQTLYDEYIDGLPLCTMSQWGWHTKPVSDNRYSYSLDDLIMTEYNCQGRIVKYPVDKIKGNEEVYDWLRKNPHRLNLARISFMYGDAEIKSVDITDIHQELKLYDGCIESNFKLHNSECNVKTCCNSNSDTLAVMVQSQLLKDGNLSIAMMFPYGSSDISASDWNSENLHSTRLIEKSNREFLLERVLDKDKYYVLVKSDLDINIIIDKHTVTIKANEDSIKLSITFSQDTKSNSISADMVYQKSKQYWNNFWEKGGIIKLRSKKDLRAEELERRIILSMYLLAINSCGSAPPQETGLTCNSWYGKMHLEMYFWHCAWAPLWNHTELLEKSLNWYISHISAAKMNADRNGYKGSRWPKMVAYDAIDSPSKIAPLLIWQQPHIIFMLELAYRQNKSNDFLKKYWMLIEETAEFMVDFAVYNDKTKKFDLLSPLIPAQECHNPKITKNPAFEVEYWRYSLQIAMLWAKRLDKQCNPKWSLVYDNMADLPVKDGAYLAHENCPETFTLFNKDHPSMLGAFGVLPSDRVDKKIMKCTLKRVIESWNFSTMWGWDFAVMAMTATRLEDCETAIDILLKDTPKNDYVASGNNRQKTRKDLPLYLPGNGSLLLAIPLMAAGCDNMKKSLPGFPDDWEVEYEKLERYV